MPTPTANYSIDPTVPDNIRVAFIEAWQGMTAVHGHCIYLRRRALRKVSMRAQPLVDSHFFTTSRRRYRIEMKEDILESIHFRLDECPHEVLVGWLAHEMGHIVDYINRSWPNLIGFGINYILSPTFRIGAERQADVFAIEHGFARQIQATKRFILKESNISDKYLSRINRYYMSPDEVEQLILERQAEEKR